MDAAAGWTLFGGGMGGILQIRTEASLFGPIATLLLGIAIVVYCEVFKGEG